MLVRFWNQLLPHGKFLFLPVKRAALLGLPQSSRKSTYLGYWQFTNCQRWDGSYQGLHWQLAPTYTDARDKYRRLCYWLDRNGVWYKQNKSRLEVVYYNKATMAYKSAENPNGWIGGTVSALSIDEASRVSEEAYVGAVSRLTVTDGPARFAGNRTGNNWFIEFCDDLANADRVRKYPASQAVADGIATPEQYAEWQSQYSALIFAELYELQDVVGQSPFADGLAKTADAEPPAATAKAIIYGIDPAQAQDNFAIVGINAAGQVCKVTAWTGKDYVTAAADAAKVVGKTRTLIDATGVGAGVADILHRNHGVSQTRITIVGGEGGGNSVNRERLLQNLAIMLEQNRLTIASIPEYQPLLTELRQFSIKSLPSGRTRWEVPSNCHDDITFAAALAAWGMRRRV